jgi:LacI family transcriptional regulator
MTTPDHPADHPGANVTIRDVARVSGLSLATVSIALRNSPRVRPATLARVHAAAEQVGYRPDPLVATLMARLRGRQPSGGVNIIAILNVGLDAERFNRSPFAREIVKGIEERASQLGFKPEMFHALEPNMTPRRMGEILHHRGINAVVIPPVANHITSVDLDWSRFASVTVGYSLLEPSLHRVSPDQYMTMKLAVNHLVDLGYRRIGLCIDTFTDQRVFQKFTAVVERHNAAVGRDRAVPILLQGGIYKDPFLTWFKKHRPEVVICPRDEVMGWIRELGLRVPEDVGYCHPCWTESRTTCSGVDQQGFLIGQATVDSVVAQIHRNERGIPASPTVLEVQPKWVDGGTVREMPESAARLDPQRAAKPFSKG